MTPYYMHNGEKCRVHLLSYYKDGSLSFIGVNDPNGESITIFRGEKVFEFEEHHDEELEQNIIWHAKKA